MSASARVLCLGLTPALQRTLVFDAVRTGHVNRAVAVTESAAGKALNTARALVTLGTPAAVAGFNGGATGRTIEALLKTYGVHSAQTPMKAATRICTTLVDRAGGTVTELVEEAPAPSAAAVRRFVRENLRAVPSAAALAISGTLPPFAGDDFYVPFVRAAVAAGVPVVIDSHRAALLRALEEKPLVAKLNDHELAATLQVPVAREEEILDGMRELRARGAQHVFMTRGGAAAYWVSAKGAWRFEPPPEGALVNPIGSGDCATAGLIHALLRGRRMADAIRCALACGTANVETMTPADFDVRRVAALTRATRMERLA